MPYSTSVYYHEGGELFAEDVGHHLALLPEVATSPREIIINDVQVEILVFHYPKNKIGCDS